MASYLQMGHDTQNLVGAEGLDSFSGIILSPLNRKNNVLKQDILKFKKISDYDIVFDPQLYYPHTEKENILTHPYFPQDFESADYSNQNWWAKIHNAIHQYCDELEVTSIIAPTIDPKSLDDQYYDFNVLNVNEFYEKRSSKNISIWAPLIISLNDLSQQDKIPRLASISSQFIADKIYLIVKADVEPRREISDSTLTTLLVKFIHELAELGKEITIAFSSSDMILYKVAGASHCATSKFFNLRRFTPSRYDENTGGGGQLPYFFTESLLAFLRGPDLLRIMERGKAELLTSTLAANIWNDRIFEKVSDLEEIPWLGDSWRQYLSWFSNTEKLIANGDPDKIADEMLKIAERNWIALEDDKVFFDEPRNDGSWIRKWRIALSEIS